MTICCVKSANTYKNILQQKWGQTLFLFFNYFVADDGYETDYNDIMKQHREMIEQQVKCANNAVKNGKLIEYVKGNIDM